MTPRSRASRLLEAHWRGETSWSSRAMTAVTAPLSTLFGVGVRTRRFLHDRGLLRQEDAPIPVVSVGNLSVGGTGKTPMTRWVAALLEELGHRPAIVARGYGEDELALHRRWFPQVPVVANPDRPQGVRTAAGEGATAAVLDDGFQHRRLARDLDVVLVSASQPFPPRLLPRGPYREPLSALGRADIVLVTVRHDPTSESGELAGARELADRLRPHATDSALVDVLPIRPAGWQDVDGATSGPPEGPVLAVASIADPAAFHRLVEAVLPRSEGVDLMAWPDHHPYSEADLAAILDRAGHRAVVTTEKDAVKLQPLLRETSDPPSVRLAVLSIEARPSERLARQMHARVAEVAGPVPPTPPREVDP